MADYETGINALDRVLCQRVYLCLSMAEDLNRQKKN